MAVYSSHASGQSPDGTTPDPRWSPVPVPPHPAAWDRAMPSRADHLARPCTGIRRSTARLLRRRGPEVAGLHRGVSVVILNLDKAEIDHPADRCFGVGPTGTGFWPDSTCRVIIGDTGSTDPEVLAAHQQAPPVRVEVVQDLKYQFSCSNNDAVRDRVRNELLVLLNNDVCCVRQNCWPWSNGSIRIPGWARPGWCSTFPTAPCNMPGSMFRAGELRLRYHPGAAKPTSTPPDVWDAVAPLVPP